MLFFDELPIAKRLRRQMRQGHYTVTFDRDFGKAMRRVGSGAKMGSFGGQVMKNVAGFDVSRMLTGSLGTLGIITEVSLKTLPRPVQELTLCLEMDEAAAIDAGNRWMAQALPLSATKEPGPSVRRPEVGWKPVSMRNTPVKSPKPKGSTPERPTLDWLRPFGAADTSEWLEKF